MSFEIGRDGVTTEPYFPPSTSGAGLIHARQLRTSFYLRRSQEILMTISMQNWKRIRDALGSISGWQSRLSE